MKYERVAGSRIYDGTRFPPLAAIPPRLGRTPGNSRGMNGTAPGLSGNSFVEYRRGSADARSNLFTQSRDTTAATIPGVGPRTSEAVMAWVDDPRRFQRIKSAGRYFGLVPCQDASARTNRLGHITREGPSIVRWMLTEAAWQGVRRPPAIRAFYERVRRENPERRKIALVATAHFLLRAMMAMLRTGEVWRVPEEAAA